MRKITVMPQGQGYVVDQPGLPGSPPVGRGPTVYAALGSWLLSFQAELGVKVDLGGMDLGGVRPGEIDGPNGLVRGLRDTAEWIRERDDHATNWLYCVRAADLLAGTADPALLPGMLAWMVARDRPVLLTEIKEAFGDTEPMLCAFDRLLRSQRIEAAFPEAKPGDSGRQFWVVVS